MVRSRIILFAALATSACSSNPGASAGGQPAPPVTSQPPTIQTFSASSSRVAPGGTTTLQWTTAGATSITIDQGVGTVSGGTITVSPSQTTLYTLTATGAGGTTTARTCVKVSQLEDAGLFPSDLGIDAPLILTGSNGGQIASATPTTGTSYSWSGSGISISAGQNRSLLEFSPTGPVGTQASLVLAGTSPCGNEASSVQIPVMAVGPQLADGANPSSGDRVFPILQMLRGERLTVSINVPSLLTLYDFQGRLVAEGPSIDVRLPVRGSYFLRAREAGAYTLKVAGIRDQLSQQIPEQPGPAQGDPTVPTAQSGRLEARLEQTAAQAYGEDLVRVNGGIVALWYDESLKASVIRRYNSAGGVQWTWSGLASSALYLRSLAPASDGGVVAVGSCGAAGPGDEICVERFSADGQLLWERRLSTGGYDYGYGIAADAKGVYVSGFTSGAFSGFSNAGGLDGFTASFGLDGNQNWVRQFGSAADDRPFAVAVAHDQIVAFGDSRGGFGVLDTTISGGGGADLFLTALDRAGNPISTRRFGTGQSDLAFDMVAGADGRIYLTGMTSGALAAGVPTPFEPQIFLAEVKSDRSLGWRTQTGPRGGQSGETLDLDGDRLSVLFYTNGNYPGGTNNSFGTRGSDDMVVAEYDTSGQFRRVSQFYDTSERIFARGIARLNGQIYVLRDRVYMPSKPFSTISIDRFSGF